jgi:tetratricopeptide (TPR) repeat protein
MALAEAYRVAGQYRDAIPAFEQASALMTALGRDDTETATTLFNNWALALHLSGRPIEAEKLFRRAIDISRAGQAEQGVSSMLLINYTRTLRVLGRPEAADYAERGYANAVQAGNQLVMNQALLVLGRIYRERGDLTRAQEMLSEVEPRLRKALPPGHLAFSRLASEYSLLASARGDLPTALQRANQAVAIAEASIKAGRGGDDYLASALVVRSDINRQLGRAGDASDAAGSGLAEEVRRTRGILERPWPRLLRHGARPPSTGKNRGSSCCISLSSRQSARYAGPGSSRHPQRPPGGRRIPTSMNRPTTRLFSRELSSFPFRFRYPK